MKAGNKVVKWGMMQIRIPDAVCCFPLFVQQSVTLTNWTCHLRWKLNQLKECFARNLRMYFLPNHYNTVSSCVYGDLTIAPKNVLHANCWNFKSLKPAPVATICRKVLGFGRGTFVRRGIRHQACWHNLASIWSTRLWPPHLIVQSHIFLSDPGVPGPIFVSGCHSVSEWDTFVRLNWCDSGWWRYQLNTNW